jgi:hypothetical protein
MSIANAILTILSVTLTSLNALSTAASGSDNAEMIVRYVTKIEKYIKEIKKLGEACCCPTSASATANEPTTEVLEVDDEDEDYGSMPIHANTPVNNSPKMPNSARTVYPTALRLNLGNLRTTK